MKKILILLSTYNGHKFLRDQLDSLYAQEGVDIHILVRDDGSKDDTVDILREYQEKYGKMTIKAELNVGCIKSFFSLLKVAAYQHADFDYYAFCDQDDVWLPYKLSQAVSVLEQSSHLDKLYFSSFRLIDINDHYIGKANIQKCIGYKGALITNAALGCTMVFTVGLIKGAIKVFEISHPYGNLNYMPLHDVWMYMYSSYANADIFYDYKYFEGLNYRQHGKNVTQYKKSFVVRAKNFFSNLNAFCGYRYNRAILLSNFKFQFPEEKTKYLELLINYKKSIFHTLLCLIKLDLSSRPIWERFIFRLFILTRKL